MKTKFLRFLSGAALITGGLAGLDLSGLTALFPAEIRGTVIAASLLLAGSKDVVVALGDLLDDGVRNNSFKMLMWVLAPIMALTLTLGLLTGCVSTTAKDGTVTRTPDKETIGIALDFFKLWAPPPPQAIEITLPPQPVPDPLRAPILRSEIDTRAGK
jgi:hypothetical protein